MQITIREPGSAITHFIGMMLAVVAAMPLVAKAGLSGSVTTVCAMMIFIGSMVLLYGASTLYHSVTVTERMLSVCSEAGPHDDICADCRFVARCA